MGICVLLTGRSLSTQISINGSNNLWSALKRLSLAASWYIIASIFTSDKNWRWREQEMERAGGGESRRWREQEVERAGGYLPPDVSCCGLQLLLTARHGRHVGINEIHDIWFVIVWEDTCKLSHRPGDGVLKHTVLGDLKIIVCTSVHVAWILGVN